MSEDFVKIDLHIHSPASKCYLGPNSDEEYLNILKKAINRDLKIISITDHNTIKGYKKLLSIKNDFDKKRENLSEITDSNQSKTKITKLTKDLELFSKIVILPGVEIEVRPGIHILVIFNKDTVIDQIEKFLYDGFF